MSIRSKVNNFIKTFEKDFNTFNIIQINAGNILHNYDLFQKELPNYEIWPVLKSNAYGHGIHQIAKILKDRSFEYIVVDSMFEAMKVWEVSNQNILLIGYVHPSNLDKLDYSKLTLTVYDLDTIRALGKLKKVVKIHLKINTGMNRQGIHSSQIDEFVGELKKYSNIILEGVCSHFADADGETDEYTNRQKAIFNEAIKKIEIYFPNIKYRHIGATAGSLKTKDLPTNAVRIGLGLYGYNPLQVTDPFHSVLQELKPALTWVSTIININEISKGDKVSYNCTFEANEDMTIGVLPLGYYEGFDRRLSNKGVVKGNERYLPVLGRVCMNLTVIDLTNTNLKLWDQVEIISSNPEDQNSIYSIAKTCNTIPYEILVKLNENTRRVII